MLLATRGRSNARIAVEVGVHVDTVRTWRARFADGGLPALACQLPAETGVPLGLEGVNTPSYVFQSAFPMIWLGVAVVGATVHSRRLPAGRARLEIWQRWWALGALGLGSLWMFLSFAGMFLWGAVIGHVYQSFANGDHAAGNTGGVLIYDLLIPALMIVLAKRSLRSDTEQPGLDVPSVGSGDAVDPELIAAIPEWAELPAVRAGQVLPWNPEPPLTFQAAAASADALTKAIDHH